MTNLHCEACGAPLEPGRTCLDYLRQLQARDFTDFNGAGRLHLLGAMTYNLQHPALYSREGLDAIKQVVKAIIESDDAYTKEHERDLSRQLASESRQWTMHATPTNQASYTTPMQWSMTIADVLADGPDDYTERVKAWGQSVYDVLVRSGEL